MLLGLLLCHLLLPLPVLLILSQFLDVFTQFLPSLLLLFFQLGFIFQLSLLLFFLRLLPVVSPLLDSKPDQLLLLLHPPAYQELMTHIVADQQEVYSDNHGDEV